MGSGAKPQPSTILVHFQGEGTLLVAFKMHGLKNQKTAFLYVSQIIVRVQAIEDLHNQIIVRVRTCRPSRDRRLCKQAVNLVENLVASGSKACRKPAAKLKRVFFLHSICLARARTSEPTAVRDQVFDKKSRKLVESVSQTRTNLSKTWLQTWSKTWFAVRFAAG